METVGDRTGLLGELGCWGIDSPTSLINHQPPPVTGALGVIGLSSRSAEILVSGFAGHWGKTIEIAVRKQKKEEPK